MLERRWLLKQNGITKITYASENKSEALRDAAFWGGSVVRMSLVHYWAWRAYFAFRELFDLDESLFE